VPRKEIQLQTETKLLEKTIFLQLFFAAPPWFLLLFVSCRKGGRWAVAGGSWFVAFATRQTIAI